MMDLVSKQEQILTGNLNKIQLQEHSYHGVPEGGQKLKKLPGYDTYIFWNYIPQGI